MEHTIKDLTITQYLKDGDLHIKATDFNNLIDYMCIVSPESIADNVILNNVELIYEILHYFNSDIVMINRDYKNNTIGIIINLKHTYFSETKEFILINSEELTNLQEMNNKLKYFNNDLKLMKLEIEDLVLYKHFVPILDANGNVRFAPKTLNSIQININQHINIWEGNVNSPNNPTFVIRDVFGISKLEFLNQFKDVSKVQLYQLTEIPTFILDFHQNIEEIYINNCSITNIAPLLKLPIKIIHISGTTSIQNLQILESIETLEELYCQNTLNIGVFSKELNFKIKPF